jgi:hypothetical protein
MNRKGKFEETSNKTKQGQKRRFEDRLIVDTYYDDILEIDK